VPEIVSLPLTWHFRPDKAEPVQFPAARWPSAKYQLRSDSLADSARALAAAGLWAQAMEVFPAIGEPQIQARAVNGITEALFAPPVPLRTASQTPAFEFD